MQVYFALGTHPKALTWKEDHSIPEKTYKRIPKSASCKIRNDKDSELTIICPQRKIPCGAKTEKPSKNREWLWRCKIWIRQKA